MVDRVMRMELSKCGANQTGKCGRCSDSRTSIDTKRIGKAL